MSMVHRLLAQLKSRGLSVKPGNEPGQLLLEGPAKERTPEVMSALKQFKPQLLELFAPKTSEPEPAPLPAEAEEPDPEPESTSQVNCWTCGKDVTDPDTRARMADPLFCSNSGKAFPTTTDAHGVIHEGSKACPYKG